MTTRVVIVLVCLLATAAVLRPSAAPERVPTRQAFDRFPLTLDSWQGRVDPIDPRVAAVLHADDYLSRVYQDGARPPIGVYAAYFRSQREGSMIHSPMNCLPGAGWQPTSQSTIVIETSDGTHPMQIEANRYIIQKGLDRELVLYWYQSHGRAIASEYTSRFFMIRDSIKLHRTDAALVRIAIPVVNGDSDSENAAERYATSFVRRFVPLLTPFIPA